MYPVTVMEFSLVQWCLMYIVFDRVLSCSLVSIMFPVTVMEFSFVYWYLNVVGKEPSPVHWCLVCIL